MLARLARVVVLTERIGLLCLECLSGRHCGLPVAELTRSTSELIGVDPALIGTAFGLELRDGELVTDSVDGEACVFLARLYRSEQAIAERLRLLSAGRPGR